MTTVGRVHPHIEGVVFGGKKKGGLWHPACGCRSPMYPAAGQTKVPLSPDALFVPSPSFPLAPAPPLHAAKVVDSHTGALLPRGAVGELCVRGYGTMLGYWADPLATARAIDQVRQGVCGAAAGGAVGGESCRLAGRSTVWLSAADKAEWGSVSVWCTPWDTPG